ncbi:MAG: hypothetical protein PF545_05585 [Elusimicrobia bacterium]|jgi:DNA-binding cell septation regulator SpoVG|nr:hypothetical protein [Elusimicrobiota bacterium]
MKKILNLSGILAGTLAGIMFSLAGTLAAGEISVTNIRIADNTATVEINNVIEIKDIEIDGKKVVFPYYKSSSGKIYTQITFLTDESRKIVETAVLNNKNTPKAIKKINYKITEMSPSGKEGTVKGFAAVVFNGVFEVQCKVMESSRTKGEYWIAWPARAPEKGEKGWKDQVAITNPKVKRIVEDSLIKKYKSGGSSGVSKNTDVNIEIINKTLIEPLTVTAVSFKDRKDETGLIGLASVDLNYSFRINDIKVYSKLGQTLIEMPKYVSSSGSEYDQIRIFDSILRKKIKAAIETRTPSQIKSQRLGYVITNFEKNKWGGSIKYKGAVTLNDAVEIQFKIIDGKTYDAFVAWPSLQEKGEYVDKIFPCNKEVKKVIESTLKKRYYEED